MKDAYAKFQTTPVDRYYILSTASPDKDELKKIDAEIQQMLDSVENKFTNATIHLTSIKNPGNNLVPLIPKLRQSIEDAVVHLKEQKDWLKEYFGKGKMGRKSMFRKYSWMGIPLN